MKNIPWRNNLACPVCTRRQCTIIYLCRGAKGKEELIILTDIPRGKQLRLSSLHYETMYLCRGVEGKEESPDCEGQGAVSLAQVNYTLHTTTKNITFAEKICRISSYSLI